MNKEDVTAGPAREYFDAIESGLEMAYITASRMYTNLMTEGIEPDTMDFIRLINSIGNSFEFLNKLKMSRICLDMEEQSLEKGQ